MADRFDTLSQKLIERLEERRLSSGPECLSASKLESYWADTSVAEAAETYLKPPHLACLSVGQLESYLGGKLASEEKGSVEAHLDGCLACLHAMVELDDLLSGVSDPAPLEAELRKRLWGGIKRSAPSTVPLSVPRRVWTAIRCALEWKAPAGWGLAGALAGVVLTLLVINVTQEQMQDITPPTDTLRLRGIPQGTPGVIGPPEVQKVTGVVSVVKQSTEGGMPYHLIRMKGDDGNTYLIFSWGKPTIQARDKVDVDAIVELQPGGTTGKIYSGWAYRISRLE